MLENARKISFQIMKFTTRSTEICCQLEKNDIRLILLDTITNPSLPYFACVCDVWPNDEKYFSRFRGTLVMRNLLKTFCSNLIELVVSGWGNFFVNADEANHPQEGNKSKCHILNIK